MGIHYLSIHQVCAEGLLLPWPCLGSWNKTEKMTSYAAHSLVGNHIVKKVSRKNC